MIDLVEAKRLARKRLDELERSVGEPLVLLESKTIVERFGWVFFYNSKKFIDTNQFQYMLAGNGPLIVSRSNGGVVEIGTDTPVEEIIEHYRNQYRERTKS